MIPSQVHTRWWAPDTGEAGTAIWRTVEWLRENDSARRERLRRLAALYSDAPMVGLGPGEYHKIETNQEGRLRLNICRNMVDAVSAKIAKNKPRASVVTDGGDFGQQQRARRLDDYLWGLFTRNDYHAKLRMKFRDAAIWGAGAFKHTTDTKRGRVGVERVYPWDVHVDPCEAYHGRPRSMFQTMLIDRGVLRGLVERWNRDEKRGRLKELLEAVDDADAERDNGGDRFADQILVAEGWHLRSDEDADDGRHVIAIEGADLRSDEWQSPDFPFTFLAWNQPLVGFWGTSLVQECEGIQLEITELAERIQRAMYMVSVPWILEPVEAEVGVITNDPNGVRIKYKGGMPPQVTSASGVPAEMFGHLDRLYARGYEEQGVSQLSAAAKKPPGIDAAVALQELNDIESERFFIKGQDYEDTVVADALQMIEASRRIEAAGGTVEVRAQVRKRRRSFLSKIKWSDVSMDDDVFDLKVFSANSLPKSPPARIQAVTSLVQAGAFTVEEALPLLDFPDLEAAMDRKLAPYEIVLDILEAMVEEGRFVAPRPHMNLGLALPIMRDSLLRLEIDGAPDDTLDMVREWTVQAESLIAEAEAAAAQAAAPMPGPVPDGGVPAPAPGADPALAAVPPAPEGMAA